MRFLVVTALLFDLEPFASVAEEPASVFLLPCLRSTHAASAFVQTSNCSSTDLFFMGMFVSLSGSEVMATLVFSPAGHSSSRNSHKKQKNRSDGCEYDDYRR